MLDARIIHRIDEVSRDRLLVLFLRYTCWGERKSEGRLEPEEKDPGDPLLASAQAS